MAQWEETGKFSARLLANNPGPMTLTGTYSYAIGRPVGSAPGSLEGWLESPTVIVDPGPLLEDHLQALAQRGKVELILITHRHADHTAGSMRLHELTGAPVRALSEAFCVDASPLSDGEVIDRAGVSVEVLATPGHTSDSVSFLVAADSPDGSVLTGDTILGEGTTVLDFPDGSLAQYFESLRRLGNLGAGKLVAALPAHGPIVANLADVARKYLDHREQRLAQVSEVASKIQQLGESISVEAVIDGVYPGISPALRRAARLSVKAQLDYLGLLPNA